MSIPELLQFDACCSELCLDEAEPDGWFLLIVGAKLDLRGRVFDEISFREKFAKLATKRFSCFAKMVYEFREFRCFAKLPRLRKKRVSQNPKISKTKKT
jgi:hypothetical protein